MTDFLVDTIQDEIAGTSDFNIEDTDGRGLALREAIVVANDSVGADTILFDTFNFNMGIVGSVLTTTFNGPLFITDDTTIEGDVEIINEGADTTIEISNGADVTFTDFTLTHSVSIFSSAAIAITGDDVSLTTNADITASGVSEFSGDRASAISITATNFTLVNEVGGSIVTEGRRAIVGVSLLTGDTTDYVIDVVNHGLIEGPDDGVSISTGTVTNTGTIRSTATFDFGGAFGSPGSVSDAVQFWGAENAGYVTPIDGEGVVNNLVTGVIEGGRSAIFFNGNGTVNNDGFITAMGSGIIGGSGRSLDFGSAPYTINNTGTITSEGFVFSPDFLTEDDIVTIALSGSSDASSIDITNSGTISGPRTVILINNGGATVINEASGEILSDIDNMGSDGIAFRGAQLDDFLVEDRPGLAFPSGGDIYENTQGITVGSGGEFFIPALGGAGFFSLFGQIDVANVGGVNPLLPLVDISATASRNNLRFQRDANGALIFPSTIDIESPNNGIITVEFDSATGFMITDANGDPVFDVPQDVDFSDTITNAGLIEGDIETGLGDDIVTNTGTLDGDIYLGAGDDTAVAGVGNTAIFGGTGDDILEGGAGADALDGGEGIDTASYEGSTNRVAINAATNSVTSGHASGDTFVSIENIIGSNFNDIITGSGDDNVINGGNGFDVLSGFSGDDTLDGGAGRDVLTGGAGADNIDGGDGISDVVRYISSSEGVTVDLGAGTASGGEAEGDVLANIEQVLGSNHADVLTGSDVNNFLFGQNGDDILDGGAGIDKLFGGAGADTFVFGAGDGAAFVSDFEDNVDSIDLTQYAFASLEDALANFDQRGANVRFFVDGETLLILNTDLEDIADDIIIEDAMV